MQDLAPTLAGQEIAEGFRLSPQQERLWLAQEATGHTPFRAQCILRVEGALRADALEAALRSVVARHEILRTTFRHLPGMTIPVQVISDDCRAEFVARDLSALDADAQQAELATLLNDAARGYDLTRTPLRRVTLARLAPQSHALLLSLPALYADRTGLENLTREIAHAYDATTRGTEVVDEPLQYADLAEWQNELLESAETEEGRRFWQQRELSAVGSLQLPSEQEGGAQSRPFVPQKLIARLDRETTARLRELAARTGTSEQTLLLACWQALLWRLTGQADVITGVAYDCRAHEGVRAALGLFARLLPIGVQLEQGLTLAGLATRTAAVEGDAAKWQDYFVWPSPAPGETGAGAGGTDFFNFCFEWSAGTSRLEAGGVGLCPTAVEVCAERFKAKLLCRQIGGEVNGGEVSASKLIEEELSDDEARGGALAIELHYDAGCYEAAESERLLARYLQLLQSSLARPDVPLDTHDIVVTAERRQVLYEFNDTGPELEHATTLHELVAAQAARTPAAIAVSFETAQLTYAELNARANSLAQRLLSLGVGPDVLVGVMLERSCDLLVGLLGVLKAGGAYVPLDPAYPSERLAFMLADAGVPVLLTQPSLRDKLPSSTARVVYLDDADTTAPASGSAANPLSAATPDNLAYIIYTSGSTGQPKGVMVSHAAICNRLLWMQHEYPLNASDRVLQKTAFSFDASIWELFVPLMAGAQVVMARPGGQQDAAYLTEVIQTRGVTTLQLVPTMLAVVLEEPGWAACRSLRRVWCGGEVVTPELVRRFFAAAPHPDLELHNLYGPTETAIDATHWLCEREDVSAQQSARGRVPIGRPLANLRVYVLDAELNPVPVGVAGELYVGGVQLARGYHRRPDLTAARFVPDPFSPQPGGRLYRTGDVVRWTTTGVLEYLRRADAQVKLRGYRIELGEVEAALGAHADVRAAVVLMREDRPKQPQLVAYVVPRPGRAQVGPGAAPYRLPNGLEVAHLNRNETEVIYKEIFQDLTYLRHGITLEDGACVFDVGANIGLFTLFVHHACRGARVFAFEPAPATFARLAHNVARYDLDAELYEGGLWERTTTAQLTFYPRMSAMSGLYSDPVGDAEVARAFMRNQDESLAGYADELLAGRFEQETVTCQLTTVSEVMRAHGVEHIDLLKIDVEKSEWEVLHGIAEADWGKISQLVLEVHDAEGRLAEIVGLLERHGYAVVVEQDALLKGTDIYNLYARRRAHDGTGGAHEHQPPRSLPALRALQPRPPLTPEALREFLAARLPAYMVPSSFVLLDALPRLPNGKLDRNALPAPAALVAAESQDTYVAPRTAGEQTLADIWAQLLGVERVGIHDNFFSLGGDSILSIQIVARANRAGLRLSPALVFTHQTVAALAAVAGTVAAVAAEQRVVTGELPLTPAQHWFFALAVPARHHWNQSVLLEARRPLDPTLLGAAVAHLFSHHDALRLRFVSEASGWRQFNAGDEEPVPFTVVDLSSVPEAAQAEAIAAAAAEWQMSLDITEGPVARVVYFALGAGRAGRVLFIAHHLVVDGVSWRVLVEDLQTAYEQLSRAEQVALAPKSTSFRAWSSSLYQYAQTEAARAELPYWLNESRRGVKSLPVDHEGAANTWETARTVTVSLTAEETDALLHKVPQAYNTQIAEVLLAAVAQTFTRWTGEPALLVDVEGHGREEIIEGVDLGRTVGWFTSLYPVLLEATAGVRAGDLLMSIKEQLRAVPGRGIGYGLLRHLCRAEAGAARLRELPQAEVSFNYLGQFDQSLEETGLFKLAPERSGAGVSGDAARSHLLEITGRVSGGRLSVTWAYSERVHRRQTIEPLAENFAAALRDIIAHCLTPAARSYTPSDFPLVRLDQSQLDRLTAGREIEDIYPLSPLQEGMLFHTVYSPQTGVYVEQVGCTVSGALDVAAFERAWQAVLDRHAVLRAAFVWEGLDHPIQIIDRRVPVPFETQDWRAESAEERSERLSAFLKSDRRRGFEPSESPLMRLTLLRVADDSYYCVWTFHHLLLDGWGVSFLLREVYAFVESFTRGEELRLEPSPPFRDYIAWLQKRSHADAELYWRRALKGFHTPTPLGGAQGAADSAPEAEHQKQQVKLSTEMMAALQAFARQHQLTMNTLVIAAWAFVLGRHAGVDDVVFGTVVSGRPAELPGVETIVGPFINTLPVRVRIEAESGLLPWLKGLQAQQSEARAHEYSPLVQVRGWSEVPPALPLFESLLTFENRPVDLSPPRDRRADDAGISLGDVFHFNRNNFPLTIVANPSGRLTLVASYDASRFDAPTVARLLGRMQRTLERMIAQPDARVGEIELLTEAEKEEQSAARQQQEASRFSRFKNVKPKAVDLSPANLVNRSYFTDGGTLPLVLRPTVADLDGFAWAANNRAFIDAELLKHGAILFRDFGLRTVEDFERFAESILPNLFSDYGDLPREEAGRRVYKSTPYPADKTILFHNESSHLRRWPLKQWFFCVTAAEQGGETPIVDCRRIYRALPPALVERFAEKRLMYVRNFTDGLDVSWQEFFKTTDKGEVERLCRQAEIDFTWKPNGLSTRQICQAVATHPRTGEPVFFNQLQLHHVSCLGSETRAAMSKLFAEEDYPRNVYYGDGTPIEDSVVEEICAVYWAHSVAFPWQAGDVLMVDNMLTAHGRNPFGGARKIVVAMGEMISAEELG